MVQVRNTIKLSSNYINSLSKELVEELTLLEAKDIKPPTDVALMNAVKTKVTKIIRAFETRERNKLTVKDIDIV